MERTFTTEIDSPVLDYPLDVEITYEIKKSYRETRYGEKRCSQIEIISTKYMSYGLEIFVCGKNWEHLERIALEKAEDHFFEHGEAA